MNDNDKKVVELNLNDILPNRFQPRIKFNEEKIYELSQSIKEHGVIQPIIVRPIGDKYEIVIGERRYKASVLADLETIPAIVLDLKDKDSIELALIENVQREDLSAIEEALSYEKILSMGYLTQEELADKLGISQSAISNKKRLLNLCDEVQEALMEKEISERHARSLLKISNEEQQRDMLYRIVSEKLTVRQLDIEIQKLLDNQDKFKDDTTLSIEKKLVEDENNSISDDKTNIDAEKKKDLDDEEFNLDDILSGLITFDEENDSVVTNTSSDSKENDIENKNVNELIKEDNRENDEMNNMLNLDEDISYNNIKNSASTGGGRFFGTKIEDEEEIVEKPVQENKSIFDFSTGKVSDGTQNNASVTRSTIAEQNMQNNVLTSSAPSYEAPNKLNDLLSPQGSSSILKTENDVFNSSPSQNSIFGLNNNIEKSSSEGESSIFANLMKSNDSNLSVIDNNELQSFLDPSFLNGKKQDSSMDTNQMNDDIFSKFIDEDFGGEIVPTKSTTELEKTNDLSSKSIFDSNVDSKIEEKNSSVFEMSDSNKSSENHNKVEIPNILDSTIKTETPVDPILVETPSIKIDSEKFDMNNLTNSSSQTELISGLMASSNKPDLLAPMNSEAASTNSKLETSFFELNQNNDSKEKEDTMLEQSIEIKENKSPEDSKLFDLSEIYNSLTPDSSIEDSKKEEENIESVISLPESVEKPVFITATKEETDIQAPTTPIITDTTMSNLLSVEKTSDEVEKTELKEIESLNNEEESVIDNKEVDEVQTPTTNNNIDIQPIIITDYNKQYDPVIPELEEKKAPKIEFKQILNMIREVSNKIEELGYVIDTEEIDMENIYQVTFNITKE